jgi:hypothetical protein
MKRVCIAVALVLVLAAQSVAYLYAEGSASGTNAPAAAGKKVYNCEACKVSMDMPGKCPVCGIELAEVVMTDEPAAPAETKKK